MYILHFWCISVGTSHISRNHAKCGGWLMCSTMQRKREKEKEKERNHLKYIFQSCTDFYSNHKSYEAYGEDEPVAKSVCVT